MGEEQSSHRAADKAVHRVLEALDRVSQHPGGWYARCPAHPDTRPSLSVSVNLAGDVLVRCHRGCRTEDIVEAVGLTMSDLFFTRTTTKAPSLIVVTYDYRDEDGAPLYQVVRREPKRFSVRRPDGVGGWVWNLDGVRRVLYRLPELLAAEADQPVLIVEGEKDVDRLIGLGFIATTNSGGAGKWRPEYSEALRNRRVLILPDNDEPGRAHATAVASSLQGITSSLATVELPGLRPKGDVSDWLDAGKSAPELSGLIQTGVAWMVAPDSGTDGQGPPPPTLAQALDAVAIHLGRFVHFADPAYVDAIALWVGHTHVPLDRLEQSPVLALTSAVKQSGKTKVLDVLEFLVARPWRITRPSESVLFRKIDHDHPTILLDEVDAIFADKAASTEGIRSVFNSGNRRGTKVPRMAPRGKTFELVEFDVFCPKATAGIGGLPDTILDRAIVIPMERRSRGERQERLREKTARRLGTPLRDAISALVGAIEDLSLPDDALPAELDDRAQDGWESLLAIADAAGADWPRRARAAAVTINAQRSSSDDSHELRLLTDCQTIFDRFTGPFIATTELIEGLTGIEESPWGDIRGKPITSHYLAKLLKQFGIRSTRHRVGGISNPFHGYLRADFEAAWERYVASPISDTSDTSGTHGGVPHDAMPADVPDVSDVSVARDLRIEQDLAVTRAAWRIFGDDLADDYPQGTA